MYRLALPSSGRRSERRAVLTSCVLAIGAVVLALFFSSLLLLLVEGQAAYQRVLLPLLALNLTMLAGLVVLIWGVARLGRWAAQSPEASLPRPQRPHQPFRPQPVLIHGTVERPRTQPVPAPGWRV